MREELDKQLVKKYPGIFRDRFADMQTTAMCWGFECDDGWYNIIDDLCGCIQGYLNSNAERNGVAQVVATQVKEKWGSLCFYYDGGDELIDGMSWLAEYQSRTTCEECGARGELMSTGGHRHGWLKTLCNDCAKNTDYKLIEVTDEL